MDFSGIVIIVKTTQEGNESVGTGFFASNEGFILTCYHVLKKANCVGVGDKIGFIFEGETRVFSAFLEGFDLEIDVALLRADYNKNIGYEFSDSEKLNEEFSTLGFPEGSLLGVVAHPSFERECPDKKHIELKKANEICPGFSGAPLINKNGLVVGMIRVVPRTIRESGSMLYVALAIPINIIIEKFSDKISAMQQDEIIDKSVSKTDLKSEEIVNFQERESKISRAIDRDLQFQDIDGIAKDTFEDLIRTWLEKTEKNNSIFLSRDLEDSDFVINLPSMQPDMSAIRTFWVIKSSSKKMEKYSNYKFQSNCFRLIFSVETIKSLREISQQHRHYYLVFAYNPLSIELSELCQCTPQERFEWYCVDLCQQLTGDDQKNFIEVPDCNRLNLSTFALLWSALWVEKFYCPLYNSKIIDVPNLLDIIKLTHPFKDKCGIELEDWNSFKHKLSICSRELEKDEYSKMAFPLGVGYSLEVIKKKLYDSASNLTAIQNYCPESLYGTANLWLFSRSYHDFMTASGQAVTLGKRNSNLRILPLPDDPQNISCLVKACLWHIVLLYSALNVEVRIIYQPLLDAGIDHSYYGGEIGYFPWLSLSDDGVTWMMEENIDATNSQHRDFINEHMENLYIDPYHSNLLEIANSLKLHINDLKTVPMCPIQLFPKEGRFIEYPYLIFGKNAFRSLDSVKLKMLREF